MPPVAAAPPIITTLATSGAKGCSVSGNSSRQGLSAAFSTPVTHFFAKANEEDHPLPSSSSTSTFDLVFHDLFQESFDSAHSLFFVVAVRTAGGAGSGHYRSSR